MKTTSVDKTTKMTTSFFGCAIDFEKVNIDSFLKMKFRISNFQNILSRLKNYKNPHDSSSKYSVV